jgi:hypothetical protein
MCPNTQVSHLQRDESPIHCHHSHPLRTLGGEAYPNEDYPFPPEVVGVPNYSGCTNTNNCANVKVTHSMALKQRNDFINMNSALINAFLDLILVAFKQSYEQIRMENPNSVFWVMFAWLVTKYGHTSADDREANCTAMTLEWHPSQGFELLVPHLLWGATFANLAKHPIPGDDIVDIGICVIHHTGLFAEEYKVWITCSNNPTNIMDFAAFHTFWEIAVNIVSFMATPALQHGYGMNAVEDNASANSLIYAVSNFGMAYTTTQESLCNNNTSINSMQGQIQMLCNAIGNHSPAGMLQYPQQKNRIVKCAAAGVANNKTMANRDNQVAVVLAQTTVVVEMDSTEATVVVADTIRAAA